MKILHAVEFYAPSVGGMQEVVRQLSERISFLGHEVTVVTTKIPKRYFSQLHSVTIKEFELSGNAVRGIEGDIEAYQNFLLEGDFDVITFFAAQQWTFDAAIPVLDRLKAKLVLVPTGFSGLFQEPYKAYFKEMPGIMQKFDANVFLSENYRDIDFAREHHVKNCVVIPNGAADDEFNGLRRRDFRKRIDMTADNFMILHVGSYTGLKGHKEAIEIFYNSSLTNAVLVLVANDLSWLRSNLWRVISFKTFLKVRFLYSKRLIMVDLKRNDTVACFHEANLFLFPSNVECSPLVLFEACASRTPFLTSDCGNAKEIIEFTGGGVLLPTKIDSQGYSHADINAAAEILNEIAGNKEYMESLAEQGYSKWIEKFTWEKIAEKYDLLYSKISIEHTAVNTGNSL